MNKNLIKIEDLSKEEILEILKLAKEIKNNPQNFFDKLKGKSMATMFFQPSTRTRISFTLAMQKAGGNTVDLYETKFQESMGIPESFEDTIKVMGDYVDLICLRHNLEEAISIAEKSTNTKIINCGNGKDQHPTQALLDLFTIWEEFGRLDDLRFSIIGSLKSSRSSHSLLVGLSMFNNNKIKLISPKNLKMPEKYFNIIKTKKNISETEDFETSEENVVYIAGFPRGEADDGISKKYELTFEKARGLKDSTIIMNPLPRIDEIEKGVDNLSNARYFQQSKNGVFVRMAIFLKLLKDYSPS